MNFYFYDTLIGKVALAETAGGITNLYFVTDPLPPSAIEQETPLLAEAARQLRSYLAGELRDFSLPLTPGGTKFFQRVWKQLQEIPYGEIATYKEIARKVGNEKSSRAVGLANNRNPLPIFIPCHRVIGTRGGLTGYRGGLAVKQRLLDLERLSGHARI